MDMGECGAPTPLVSCIMPTFNRRSFVRQALWYFLRQDYPNKELIVLDDGDDAVADLMPADERIRYVRLDRRMPLGAKRNTACEMGRGELIAHWDDDDWIAPHRLSTQVRELIESGADVGGSAELLHYGVESGEAWLYRRRPAERPWVAGPTLLYRRDAWARTPFPEIGVGEDEQFIARQPAERIRAARDPHLLVALIHRGNTSAKRLADPRWERRPLEEVSRLLAHDREFYATLRNGPQRPRQKCAQETITVAAPMLVYDGYGSLAELVILGMRDAGATINLVPLHLDPNGLRDATRELLRRSSPTISDATLYFCWPRPELERFRSARDLFIYTMWESGRLPTDWPRRLAGMRAVFVPTRFVAEVCRSSGVSTAVEVIPAGVDPAVYSYIERPDRAGLTTLIVGTVIARKHVREAIAGWKLAFDGDRDARLIVKSRFRYGNYRPDDPRILFTDDNEPTRGIAHWYEKADVVVAVGSEGFGLPLVEGMATGLPVIALGSEGQGDTCAEAGPERVLAIAPERWEEANEPEFGRCGLRGVPGVRDIAARLRWVAGHRDEARAMGKAASEWVLQHRNVWNTGPAVLDAMERHARPARSLRRVPTLWVPSWKRQPCGIAEYTEHLTGSMAHVRVSADPPDLRGARLLHVQHEPSLFNDTVLSTWLQRAAADRVPVIVTEHAVASGGWQWEREAAMLTSLTASGAAMLRARWPGKRVEHIPCGCPTWFPPRKKTRGRTIGAFGFLEPHKGFWKLLDVVRAIPGSELLLVSHSKSAVNEERWAIDSAGLPVRRHREFMPIEDAVRLLAAEADVLVYWYDEVAHVSASAAVCIGLATGVPVLTSPTKWFGDLNAVTHQPDDLTEGVRRMFDDTALRDELTSAARDYCHEHSWARTAERHLSLWRSLDALN